VCYYQAHLGQDGARNLSQYVSLALSLQGPPHFLPKAKEDELPPDAAPVVGFAAVLERFYDKAGLRAIWEQNKNAYAVLTDRYHEPLAKMVFDTEIYLKLASSGYLGRTSPYIWILWVLRVRSMRGTMARIITW